MAQVAVWAGNLHHAAGAPEKGRSALDAVELMNIGVQFLREHMGSRARIHYAITDAGGCSPNVVQPRASVLYMVRSNHVAEAVELQARVDRIADGAALMTDTSLERKFIDGLAATVSNSVLEQVLYDCFRELGVPAHTEEELAFADALAKTYEGGDAARGIAAENDENLREQVARLQKEAGHAMNDFLAPLYQGDAFTAGSTDVGDVSWLTPTAQIHVAAWPNGCPGHSWQNVSCGGVSLGKKAAVHAAKVLAAAVVELMEQPELLKQARAEFEKRTAAGYVCPIPADAVPGPRCPSLCNGRRHGSPARLSLMAAAPPRLSYKTADARRAGLTEAGISVWSLGSPYGKSGIRGPFGPRLDEFRRGLELALALGASHIRLFSFFLPREEAPQVFRDEVLERLSRFCEAAQGSGIVLCHENEKGIYGDTAPHCAEIHRALPDLRAVFDPANFIQCGQPTLPAWELLAPYVEYMHIKDALADGSVVPAGCGEGHLPELLEQYQGTVLTLEPHLAVFKGLAALEQEGARTDIPSYRYTSNREAFAAAAAALRGLIQNRT